MRAQLLLTLCVAVARLAAAAESAANASTATEPFRLDEPRAVELALQNTLAVKLSLLRRDTERYAFHVARNQFVPTLNVTAAAGRRTSQAQPGDRAPLDQRANESAELGPVIAWQIPTGGEFSYAWSNRFADARGSLDHLAGAPTPSWNLGWTVSFSQPLLRGGGLTVGTASLRQARIAEKLSQLGFRSAIIGAVNDVLGTLRGYVQTREAEAIATRSLERGRQMLDVQRDLQKTGRISRSEVTQSEADFASRELAQLAARNATDSARLRLARLLALPATTQFAVELPTKVQPVTSTLPRALEIAWRERPDWTASLLANDAADLGLALAKNSQLWDLRLAATHGRASLHTATSSYATAYGGLTRPDAQESFIGLTLSVPVWDNHARRAGLIAVRNSRRDRELTHENLRHSIELEVIDQLRNLEVAWKSLELARNSRALADTALQDESVRLSSGLTTTLNMTRLEDALVAAQNAELGAVLGYLNAVTAFDTTLGTTLSSWRITLDPERGEPPRIVP